MELSRRRLLAMTAGVAALGSVAGCTGSGGSTEPAASDTPTAQASFFVFGDLTAAVAGDAATAELLTPVGQHGHGWEPGPRVRESIQDAALFVHGMEGFQPWVDRILPDLEADGSTARTLDVSADVELLPVGDDHSHDHDSEGDNHDSEPSGEDHDSEGDDHDDEHSGDDHDDEHDSEHSGDDHDSDHDDEHSGEDDSSHAGAADPHFWMDPLRLAEAVDSVRDGLTAADEPNADAYAANAEQFRTALMDLDEQIESVVAGGSADVILVAGHNSFRYFGDRYGLTIESLTTVSPDDNPTAQDIERARELIVDHGLRYICADPLESQRAAEQLVAETDAEAVLPLTAMPGLTQEWSDEGWGYVDIATNVNLPTLEQALSK